MQAAARPIQPGERAPGFVLAAVNREGTVSLEDFRGKRALMIGFFRGLHCPFCRRQIAQLGAAQPALLSHGVETVAVINTPQDRARLYFRYRPTPATLLSDPQCATHAAYGVPRIAFLEPGDRSPAQWPARTPAELFEAARIDPGGELGSPASPMQANEILNAKDGFELTETDRRIFAAHGTQLAAHFLVDREGVVRWAWTEAPTSPQELCRFPALSEMVAAARGMTQLQR